MPAHGAAAADPAEMITGSTADLRDFFKGRSSAAHMADFAMGATLGVHALLSRVGRLSISL